MSMFRVDITVVNMKNEDISSSQVKALVDTGSELTWIPREILEKTGIKPRRERQFVTADGKHLTREIGYAILRVDEYETTDEVVFAEKGDLSLLGVRTIEGFGVMVDNIGHRFVAQTSIVA